MAGVLLDSPFFRSLAEEHRRWLAAFVPQKSANWRKNLRADEESALAVTERRGVVRAFREQVVRETWDELGLSRDENQVRAARAATPPASMERSTIHDRRCALRPPARNPLGFQKETTTDIADGRGFETEEGDGGRT
jgi:hypothetical protein